MLSVIAFFLHFRNKYLFKRQGDEFIEISTCVFKIASAKLLVTRNDTAEHSASYGCLAKAQAVASKLFGHSLKSRLNGANVILKGVDLAFKEHLTLMKQGKVVAYILKLAQVVRCEDYGHIPFRYLGGDKALYKLAYNGVKSVKGLVAEQVVGACGKSENYGCLLLHSLGEGVYLPCGGKPELACKLLCALTVKARVNGGKICGVLAYRRMREEEMVIGKVKQLCLCLGILPHVCSVHKYLALIGGEYTRYHT